MKLKKRKNLIILYLILGLLAIWFVSQLYIFTLSEDEIDSDLIGFFRLQNDSEVLNYEGVDVQKSNNDLTITAIYRVTLASGIEKFYVVSYMKSLILPRYVRASYEDFTDNSIMEFKAPGYLKDSYYTVSERGLIPHGYHDKRGLSLLIFFAFVVMVYIFRVILDKITDKIKNSKN